MRPQRRRAAGVRRSRFAALLAVEILVADGILGVALVTAVIFDTDVSQFDTLGRQFTAVAFAVLPATRWIVRRRLDLVIGGMGALAALLGVLFVSAVFGP